MDYKTLKMLGVVVIGGIITGLVLNYGSSVGILHDSANGYNNSII